MFERPHSRKVKIEEGTVEVKKGAKLDNMPMAGGGGAPIAGNEKDDEDEKEKKD